MVALAVTPIIGFFTNVATELRDEDEPAAMGILFILVTSIAITGAFLIKKLNQADEDDYWDYSSLVRDLQDEIDADKFPSTVRVTKYRHALARLDKELAGSDGWLNRHPRGARWRQAAEAARFVRDDPKARFRSFASSIRKKDAAVYLWRHRRRSLSYALAAASGIAMILTSHIDWSNSPLPQVPLAGLFVLVSTVPWIGLALCVARLRLTNTLAWLAVRMNQSQHCAQLLIKLEVSNAPMNATRPALEYYPLSDRLSDAWGILRSSRKTKES